MRADNKREKGRPHETRGGRKGGGEEGKERWVHTCELFRKSGNFLTSPDVSQWNCLDRSLAHYGIVWIEV